MTRVNRRVLDYGEHAVLVECADLDDALGLLGALSEQPFPQLSEVIPGARTLLLRLAGSLNPDQRAELARLPARQLTAGDQQQVTVEVDYSGPDLAEVASLTGLSTDEVVQTHTGQIWTVGFCGFTPGFGYLHGQHDRLRVPRRAAPRKVVPQGSVGLADHWSGIYPRAGPGGWQLIGRTEVSLWDLDQSPPALLQPGMQVRFVQRGAG
jgi:KipI family sensor histidine kinase inhibitor